MNSIAFDTSTEACTIALQTTKGTWCDHHLAPREHHRLLLFGIQRLLAQAGISAKDLQRIVCGIGPGSFVGTRMALGTAQGMAFGLNLKIVPLSTLQTIAQGVYRQRQDLTQIRVTQEANRQKIYVGWYRLKDGLMQAFLEERLIARDTLAPEKAFASIQNGHPHAADMLDLATLVEAMAPERVFPRYLDDAGFWQKSQHLDV